MTSTLKALPISLGGFFIDTIKNEAEIYYIERNNVWQRTRYK
jgi:hypothetical protein